VSPTTIGYYLYACHQLNIWLRSWKLYPVLTLISMFSSNRTPWVNISFLKLICIFKHNGVTGGVITTPKLQPNHVMSCVWISCLLICQIFWPLSTIMGIFTVYLLLRQPTPTQVVHLLVWTEVFRIATLVFFIIYFSCLGLLHLAYCSYQHALTNVSASLAKL
jgi:hypothetical protein